MDGVEALRASVRGNVLLPADEGFAEAIKVWGVSPSHTLNGQTAPTPALVIQPRGEGGRCRPCRRWPRCLPAAGLPFCGPGGQDVSLLQTAGQRCTCACAAGTADVVAAVKFATSHGLQLAARSGGHGAVRARPLLDPCVPAAASAAAAGAWLLPGMVCSPSSRVEPPCHLGPCLPAACSLPVWRLPAGPSPWLQGNPSWVDGGLMVDMSLMGRWVMCT